MKLTDYLAEFFAEKGVRHVFGLTGGAVVHLFDSAARNGKLTPIFTHHEQSAAFAAQMYARVTRNCGLCFVTTGPGVTNALTGLAAAWLDSVPCIYVSGQARLAHTTRGKKIRQLGTQQLDVIDIVKPVTKYAVMLDDPRSIRFHLEKAWHIATSGRPGPVWIDLPLDMQWAQVDPGAMERYVPPDEGVPAKTPSDEHVERFKLLLANARRPLAMAGYGLFWGRADAEFRQFVENHQIPFISTWGAVDILPGDHPLHVGRPGISGQRGANLAIQNCDLLICLGSHLCIPVTGTMFKAFAREATIVMVDIDADELEERTIPVDLPIQADVRQFLSAVLEPRNGKPLAIEEWRQYCARYRRYNAPPDEGPAPSAISSHALVKAVSDCSSDGDLVVVDGGGTNVYYSFLTFEVKAGQRMLLSTGLCAMGSGLPESIGACFAGGFRRTICLCGDGSVQLNVQELQTIKHHNLPVKIFVSNNNGYISIRQTQDGFLDGRHVGSEASGGMSLPDFRKVAEAYGIATCLIDSPRALREGVQHVLDRPGPVLCEVVVSSDQELNPRQGFDRKPDGTFVPRPLEDMAPFMDRTEFMRNMIVRPWDPQNPPTRR